MSDPGRSGPASPRLARDGDAARPISPAAWRELAALLDDVLDTPVPLRGARIGGLCGDDAAKRAELERMVAECERAYPLLDSPVAERFPSLLDLAALPVPGSLAGQYRVEREVGRGGMAVVYLARDLKHERDVALKVVRPELAASIARVRFLHEIRVAAGLRHPHIVPLFDSGEVSGREEESGAEASFLYYVMPYEPGRSLRARLAEDGPLAVDDVASILRDITEALAHAHEQGIVHRDIKPDNVLLSGRHALVTDFGVARAVTAAAAAAEAGPGSTVVGTPAYMAPEQAVPGERVDHRADIYAIGVLGHELLAGRPPFGPDLPPVARPPAGDVIRELVRLRPDVPAVLADALARCLATRPEDRWASASELLEHLSASALAGGTAPPAAHPAHGRRTLGLAGGGALLLAGLAFVIFGVRGRGEPVALRLGPAHQLTSEPGLEVQPSISPDGREVAYAAGNSLRMRIAVRPAAGGRARWLTADTSANQWLPRWSPDGSRILFLSGGGVSSAPAQGGTTRQEIAARAGAVVRSASWSPDAQAIAYVRGDSLLVRKLRSGTTRLVTTSPDLHSCSWSPAGEWLACVSGNSFYVTVGATSGVGPMFANLAPSTIVLVPATGGRPVGVTDSVALNQGPVWARDGRTLFFVSNRDGPRDVYALAVRRGGRPGGAAVRITTGINAQALDFSADGRRLAYTVYASTANVWRLPIPPGAGKLPVSASARYARALTSGTQTVEGVRVSADGRWLVYDSDLAGNSDIYRMAIVGGEPERLTRDSVNEFRGALSPDGRELAFHAFRDGVREIFLLDLASGAVRRLTGSAGQVAMANWSPDGSALACFDMVAGNVLVLRRDVRGDWSAPRVVSHGWRPEWSPDGRTIAFVSPADGRIGLVSAAGGAPRDGYVPRPGEPLAELALFSADGRQLYFKSHDASGRASFWAVPARGGRPRPLVRFDDPAWSSNRFDFASDGTRFYFTVEDRESDVWIGDVVAR